MSLTLQRCGSLNTCWTDPFPYDLVPQDAGARMVLKSRRHDLGRGCRRWTNEHDDRQHRVGLGASIGKPDGPGVWPAPDLRDQLPLFQKQSHDAEGLTQEATRIRAQVENQAFHAGVDETVDRMAYVVCCAPPKCGEVDDTDPRPIDHGGLNRRDPHPSAAYLASKSLQATC